MQGFSGALSDKLQKRKPIALAGYLLAAIAKPLIGLSTVWQGVLGARVLDRCGAGGRSAPRDALIASSVDEENRGRAFGLEGIGDNAGAFLGPLLAVFLIFSLQVDIRYIFYWAFVPGLLAFLICHPCYRLRLQSCIGHQCAFGHDEAGLCQTPSDRRLQQH